MDWKNDNRQGLDVLPMTGQVATYDNVTTSAFESTRDDDLNLVQRRKFEAPQSHEEKIIAQIWQELLEIDKIGVHDNFLLLGGESLLATQVVTRLREAFQVEVPVRSIFLETVSEIAADIARATRKHNGQTSTEHIGKSMQA